jgi:hypothetical protein
VTPIMKKRKRRRRRRRRRRRNDEENNSKKSCLLSKVLRKYIASLHIPPLNLFERHRAI